MSNELVAIIEDEEDLLELVEYNLQKNGYDTVGFLSTKNVTQLLNEEDVDLLIVDRNLPGVEGSEYVKDLRDKGINIPAIFVTAKDKEEDIVDGFEKGGDDYITKPFNMNELLLRVKAILRRAKREAEKLAFKDILMDLKTRKVFVEEGEVTLTRLEFELLRTFIQNKNSVLNREYLLEHVWKDEEFFQEKTVNVAINRLKKKIDPSKQKDYIKSIWGVGYRLC